VENLQVLFTDAQVAEMKAVQIQVVEATIIKQGAEAKQRLVKTVRIQNTKKNNLIGGNTYD